MLVNISNPVEDHNLLPPALAEIGVTGEVAPAPGMVMGRFHITPNSQTLRQYSVNADLALFVVEGSGILITGPQHLSETDSFEDKDFIYIERGEIFALENNSGENCRIIFTYVGVDRPEELERTFIDDPTS